MNIINTAIPEIVIFEPKLYGDERGFFFESYNQKIFDEVVGQHVTFVQDNHSKSSKNVLRGLHYQLAPYDQGKLVRCIAGSVLDVAVDIRKESQNYGKWVSVLLSSENKRQLWIPEGFAHGFLSLEDNTEFLYKTTNFYNPESERAYIWNDPTLNIDWRITNPIVSEKDKLAPLFDAD
ncbi:dTDP-4-dehydrorhamnose 3,5-epimerase [Citrobacter braakii]|uniref:dTDP-4-dehydrorhamnose 3,5-epimerase n=1 Tax=Citrobacter braakii TaxID=57706 RepID=UPI0025A76B93|nr:dTDP-4-dehydrorhamnose 3,5-epimerase [Citrobacter braakii]EKW2139050.1 dTDP-4-dehydrorhamnose 3,5-epimerase [Citrobacter braakii]MDW2593404.1 dTDP-4-dehydrorhamnose 3,5-epimerase [Citrobacter braakii]MDW2657263.1 dTDP-4-dehydrorhamnose 3,5-epimerase [Citrobacter braakii]MDW2704932.1 dTDP-4-dehydrorhamnose 3,5-epimerase [Citrobacter braakii]